MRPDISWAEIARLLSPGAGSVPALESAWQQRYGYDHVVWFPYARLAMQCFLECLEPRPRRVVMPAFTCAEVGSAVARAGLSALLVDVELATHQQQPDVFRSALAQVGSVGIAIRTWGGSLNVAELAGPVLYDYAMAALDRTRPRLRDGDAVVYSLGRGKPLYGLHGGLLCGSSESAERWRRWREGRLEPRSHLREALRLLIERVAFEPALFGILANVSEHRRWRPRRAAGADPDLPRDAWEKLGAGALGMCLDRIDRLDALRAERARQVAIYDAGLRDLREPSLAWLEPEPFLSHFPIRTVERASLRQHMMREGIFCSEKLYESTLAEHPALRREAGPEPIIAKRLTRELLHLPLYRGLSDGEQSRVLESIRRFFRR